MIRTDLLADLERAGLRRVVAGEPMARHTSWRIGGPADLFCQVETEQQLRAAVDLAHDHRVPWLVLGGGNNVLVSDDGIAGLVILNRLRGLQIGEDAHGPLLECGAGVFFARAAQFSARDGYSGMEWGIAIPGTIGGGVVNNAGAHFSDVARSIISADVLFPDGTSRRLPAAELEYSYRHSRFKTPVSTRSEVVVTSARFRLARATAVEAAERLEELRQHRLRTQPVKEASAGSTFTNPPNDHAGALIERAGLKGHRIGGAEIAPLHANFILNRGGATAADVVALIALAQERVQQQFGVRLVPEVQFVGRWPDGAPVRG